MLAFLLSQPDGYPVNAAEIARQGKEGRDAIETAIRELRACGYVLRRKEQNERGQWVTYTDVFEVPEQVQQPAADNGFPGAGAEATDPWESDAGNLGAIEKERVEKEQKEKTTSSPSPAPGAEIVPMPTRVPAAMAALEALIGDLQAELDQGHRSWDMTGLAQKRWVELLDLCGGDLYPAQQFLGWFIRALVGVELGGHDWRRAFVLVRQWRGYAIKGAAEAIHHGRLPGGDADREATDRFWNYAGAVCKAEIARARKEGA